MSPLYELCKLAQCEIKSKEAVKDADCVLLKEIKSYSVFLLCNYSEV